MRDNFRGKDSAQFTRTQKVKLTSLSEPEQLGLHAYTQAQTHTHTHTQMLLQRDTQNKFTKIAHSTDRALSYNYNYSIHCTLK